MKSTFLAIAVLTTGSLMSANWTVDSNISRPADFRTVQAAHNSASVAPGDVLYLMPCSVSYGALTMTKPLTIIGTGYLLNQNLPFNVPAPSARTSTINFGPGSDGSMITGLEVEGNIAFIKVDEVFPSHITIKRNYIKGSISTATGANSSNIQILQNHVTSGCNFGPSQNSGMVIRGNFGGGEP